MTTSFSLYKSLTTTQTRKQLGELPLPPCYHSIHSQSCFVLNRNIALMLIECETASFNHQVKGKLIKSQDATNMNLVVTWLSTTS